MSFGWKKRVRRSLLPPLLFCHAWKSYVALLREIKRRLVAEIVGSLTVSGVVCVSSNPVWSMNWCGLYSWHGSKCLSCFLVWGSPCEASVRDHSSPPAKLLETLPSEENQTSLSVQVCSLRAEIKHIAVEGDTLAWCQNCCTNHFIFFVQLWSNCAWG